MKNYHKRSLPLNLILVGVCFMIFFRKMSISDPTGPVGVKGVKVKVVEDFSVGAV